MGTVDWGDGTSETQIIDEPGPVTASHTHFTPGSYELAFTVADKDRAKSIRRAKLIIKRVRTRTDFVPTDPKNGVKKNAVRFSVTVFGRKDLDVSKIDLPRVRLKGKLGSGKTGLARSPSGAFVVSPPTHQDSDGIPDRTLFFDMAEAELNGDVHRTVGSVQELLLTFEAAKVAFEAVDTIFILPP